jgi:hypothetical protein
MSANTDGDDQQPIAYLYSDARTPKDAHPWLHSTMLVLAPDRRPGLQGETELFTRAQLDAAVAAERERCAQVCELHSRLTWNDDRKAQSRVLAEEIRRWPNTDPQP